jgi:UDP-2,4-diacetamido-2,4,6-trideoxy-beta-L-altropyranose hydrolase
VQSLASASLAVVGAGTTMWEAACLGVPTVSVVVAENQSQPASAAEALGFTSCVDARAPGAEDEIDRRIVELLDDETMLTEMSLRGRREVDGAGAHRVATILDDLVSTRRRAHC